MQIPAPMPMQPAVEITETEFQRSFSFPIERDMVKTVSVERKEQAFTISIHYRDSVGEEQALETFEADGPVSISLADGGLYITSSRSLLSGRIRLRRTRFF